ncbi:hypothetical protein FA10DRAFT_302843 [Acaromyces ingoldii]|uniref:Shikimate kinase n=1 Tax=Acaromyces ingoldii TaxID=215250 RepID=A0A316YJY0_9BASI|nr:hypothetical protein FA10DRAFT_302843 [Acaromyces ingoldii]PWN89519.1 hypothetical protein FA10DRAFT_302843 [Acaromyces ingoldii]
MAIDTAMEAPEEKEKEGREREQEEQDAVVAGTEGAAAAAHTGPSLVLIMGMRSAGKTTLGRLAAEHLPGHVAFLDADDEFCRLHAPHTPKTFVAAHGWPAFRAAETEILRSVLAAHHPQQQQQQQQQQCRQPSKLVVSLGGGVVEEPANRAMLTAAWSGADGLLDVEKRTAVVHVFREVDYVVHEADGRRAGARAKPAWVGVGGAEEVWARRRPWFRECSSHEFVNFTEPGAGDEAESSLQARLRFEAVERDFVRFLARLVSSFSGRGKPMFGAADDGNDAAAAATAAAARSYLVTLPFADLYPHVAHLRQLSTGASAIELRADLLVDPTPDSRAGGSNEAYENPSLSYLSEQVGLVRRHLADLPLVFSLRTPAQGGRYPYPADAPASALFRSLHHALKLGVDCLDVEQGLDAAMTQRLLSDAGRRQTCVIVSWRDTLPPDQGGFAWGSQRATELYEGACRLGADVVKIVGTAGDTNDNFALRLFASAVSGEREKETTTRRPRRPPLCAYNMGYRGRISRFLNPTLASITHPLAKTLTSEGIVGSPSMTFREVQQALHLSGLIESRTYVGLTKRDDGGGSGGGGLDSDGGVVGGNSSRVTGDEESSRYAAWSLELGLPYAARTESCQGLGERLNYLLGHERDLMGLWLGEGDEVWKRDEALLLRCTTLSDEVTATRCIDTIILRKDKQGYKTLHGRNCLVEAIRGLVRETLSPSIHLTRSSLAVVLASSGRGGYSGGFDDDDTYTYTTIITNEDDDDDESDEQDSVATRSAVCALHGAGLERVVVRDPASPGALDFDRSPTIVVGACRSMHQAQIDAAKLLANQQGGLYIDLLRRDGSTGCDMVERVKEAKDRGWRLLDDRQVRDRVQSQRFFSFTGVLPPSYSSSSPSSVPYAAPQPLLSPSQI